METDGGTVRLVTLRLLRPAKSPSASQAHKSARYYLNRVNPIDEFEVTPDGLSFVNLSARYGFAGPETNRAVTAALGMRSNPYAVTYRVRWSAYDNASDSTRPLGETREQTETTVVLP